ncbi:3-deoxy-manno-octulosonate cytidylyltransferase [Rhodobacteraceae bacterium]|nr:3-deoxy-manno-octulosonate cytidylyltransferase [Paracoccaceae bacterium]
MKTVIIIPARYGSTRYPGKPLVELRTREGKKSLIQLSWEAANKVSGVTEIYVATDDKRIEDHAVSFGAKVIRTSLKCKNGTERCAEAVNNAQLDAEIIINFQGDAPLTPSWFVENIITALKADKSIDMATPVLRLDKKSYNLFFDDRKSDRVGGTTVVFDKQMFALYFSKELIPFFEISKFGSDEQIPCYHHVGVYAYRKNILKDYLRWPESNLEKLEGLEQLRFLVENKRVKCVEVDNKGRVFWELNNPQDVQLIEKVLF